MIKIVGLDISLNNLGVCKASIDGGKLIVNEVCVKKPEKADAQTKKQVRKNSDDLRRARELRASVAEAINDADIVCVEMPVGSQSARAMASYGLSVGVIASIDKPLIEVTPTEVKLAGAGVRTATKSEMIEWATDKHPEANWKRRKVNGKLAITNDNEHAADALAAIYAGMQTTEFKGIMAFVNAMKRSPKELVA